MEHQALSARLPELAQAEQKIIDLAETYGDAVPAGTYEVHEAYCPLPNCDCQRVTLSVYSVQDQQTKASIAFGWETFMFYAQWYGSTNPDSLQSIKGPALLSDRPQSPVAQTVLKMVEALVLADSNYVESLRKHYRLFKADVKLAAKKTGTANKKTLRKR